MSLFAIIFAIVMLIVHRATFSPFEITMVILLCMLIVSVDVNTAKKK